MCESVESTPKCCKHADSRFSVPPTPLLSRIGYGTGVGVYRLERGCDTGDSVEFSPWALKKVSRKFAHGDFAQRIKREAQLLKGLQHPNIVGFRGFTTTPDGREVLAMEECSISLGDLIEERLEGDLGPFPATQILSVARCVASALHYLHTEKRLIHGDIKSHNVLIKGKLEEIKLCDFGVSVEIDSDGVGALEDYVGTPCWSAPETLGQGPLTHKADIFSFGLLLWEMIALSPPHLPRTTDSDLDRSDLDLSLSLTLHKHNYGTRPEIPERAGLGLDYERVLDLFERCTESDYQQRPSAHQILALLSHSPR